MSLALRGIESSRLIYKDISLSASDTTAEIDLLGGTLVGVTIPELTSTSFTITAATTSGGTFRTVREALNTFTSADNDITFTIGSTSVGYYPIPPTLTAGLQFIKLVFSSSETATITIAYRGID